ncbi:MAG: helicase, partial [Clostridia bacterium]|nr:helicase [Clostridia bacterium]
MNNNDLTFFTNEPERNLYDRFSKILNKNTQFFDVLVGYFRASGFYLLQDALKNVDKTRILIGINTDKQIISMYENTQQEIKELSLSNIEAIDGYKKNLENEFASSEDSEEVEDGVNKFVKLIKEGKLEIRVFTKQQIHAKLYIMRDYKDSPDFGRVITGSSNFSQNGLINNLEFNVELKNSADVEFALEKFEELWSESVEISNDCVNTIENKTWIKSDITPYEMYVKFLYEYFKEEINDDIHVENDKSKLYPDGFVPLQYQRDAVIQSKRILEKHNGIFISDVVGLGKTYICALLAQELEGKKLFLCPPVLTEYWDNVLFNFNVRGYKVESEGKLDKIIENGTEQFDYIFVDESHRFRNADTEQYKQLHEICVGKKVILISATPQNNYNTDIANQLYLFQSKNQSTIVSVRNLELFFDELRRKVKSCDKESEEYKKIIRETSEEIRDKVLREVMIRRTRTEIQKTYAEDLKKQGLKFPKVSDPQKLLYQFSNETEEVFETTIEKIQELNYSRYRPMLYVKQEKLLPNQKSLLAGQMNMGGFMKGILVKRLESSKYAFEMTLNRFIKSYKEFINMYKENGVIWISKKLDVNELILNDDIEKLEDAVKNEDAFKFNAEDFHKNFIIDLENDLSILENLQYIWNSIKNDDKLEYFIEELKKRNEFKHNKLIIFTESKETAEYLTNEISNRTKENVLLFTGSMPDSIRNSIRANFDPNYNKDKQKNDYRILVTTDVLAEGMNLHRSNVIINYDLPWNPTRIMQRVGRINRVGTKHDEIYVFNFFPTSKSSEQMSLEENIITKMQMFHDILGEDSKFLTDDEEVSTHELFRRINA